jgi:hypothetical protein
MAGRRKSDRHLPRALVLVCVLNAALSISALVAIYRFYHTVGLFLATLEDHSHARQFRMGGIPQ